MDMYEKLDVLLNADGEDEVVEFKKAKSNYNFEKLGRYFSALSNEANLHGKPAAWLVFGVHDKQYVVGSNYRADRSSLQRLKKEIADKTTQRVTFVAIHEVRHEKGRVLMFQIPPAPLGIPVAWDGHYYGRDGESLGPLNIEEIERIRAQANTSDWSAGTLAAAFLDDLDPEAIEVARERFIQKNPKLAEAAAQWDAKTFLDKAKLTIRGKITRTAVLLLGKPEASYLLNPASATITWLLKDRDGLERDYEHFSCPLLMEVNEVFRKIRNLKYRYLQESTLFPEEVDQFDPYIIREALNNAIAHQDYELGGRVTLTEFEDGRLLFSNYGGFIPGSVESVIHADAPESRYRNRFLVDAMVNLNMIDTIGSGIRRMFFIQKERFFPLPEYDLSHNRVLVSITGRVLDMAYARKLAQHPDLSLDDIVLLDRVQKGKPLSGQQAKHLKNKNLVEGRKPNYYISAELAEHTDERAEYIRHRGLDAQHYRQLVVKYLEQFGEAKRKDIDSLLQDKLPDVLDNKKKQNKIKNILQSMRRDGVIETQGKTWRMSK